MEGSGSRPRRSKNFAWRFLETVNWAEDRRHGLDRNRAAPTCCQKSCLNGTRCCPINIWCYNRICPSGQRLCFCRHHFIRFGRGCRFGDMAVALSRDVLPRWLTLPAALTHRARLLPRGSSTNQVDGGPAASTLSWCRARSGSCAQPGRATSLADRSRRACPPAGAVAGGQFHKSGRWRPRRAP